jgi:hypothetical protein
MYYNVEFKLQILQRNVGLKYIDLEQMHRKLKEKKNDYFEMIFMNRFIEEKMPAALVNKDGPCSEFSSTFPNIICKNQHTTFTYIAVLRTYTLFLFMNGPFNRPLMRDLTIK